MDRPPLSEPEKRPSGDLGRVSFGFLLVSAATGLMLSPFWSASAPLDSLERLEGGLPWGFLLRGLHAFSSYGLLATLAGHLLEVVAARTERRLAPAVWWRSTLLLPLAVLGLLSGFVLRGDAEAAAALAVWRRILESLPALGAETAGILLGTFPGDLGTIALHHAGTATLLLWLLTAEHAGRLAPDSRSSVLAGLVSLGLAGAVPLSLGPPPSGAPAAILLGPWYLLGLQGALIDLPVAAGWLIPLSLVALLGLLRHAGEGARRLLLGALSAWVLAYAAFTVRVVLLWQAR